MIHMALAVVAPEVTSAVQGVTILMVLAQAQAQAQEDLVVTILMAKVDKEVVSVDPMTLPTDKEVKVVKEAVNTEVETKILLTRLRESIHYQQYLL